MRAHALFSRAFQAQVAQAHHINGLDFGGSAAVRIITSTAAVLLVVASAGFGATFALSQGLHHGPVLAGFGLAMALGLECAKPFAVEGIFASLRSWGVGRALAMTLLAIVAIGYSLTAELSLMAMTRGDAAAGRAKAADAIKYDRAELTRIVAERSTMTFTPASEAGVSTAREAVAAAARTRAAECEQRGKNCRQRENEESTARQRLAEVIANKEATGRAGVLDGKADAIRSRLATAPATAAADPGAAALASYMALFGVTVPASILSEWLVLVGVIALETGSALAVVLVHAAGWRQAERRAPVQEFPARRRQPESEKGAVAPPEPRETVKPPVSRNSRRGRPPRERLEAEAKVIDILRTEGGKVPSSSTRKLGKMAGVRKSTMHIALAALIAAGTVAKTASGALILNG